VDARWTPLRPSGGTYLDVRNVHVVGIEHLRGGLLWHNYERGGFLWRTIR
jgi:hypothetical protein